ncbi:MAG: (deoxy)nucleoside triphosphate pyrophosphohydrolase [Vicinamibacteraceae bacterium]
MTADRAIVVVAAAIIERDGCWLLARRLKGTHLEGLWEFPGGKIDPGETLEACLVRELAEELGVESRVASLRWSTAHDYPSKRVELHFYDCTISGEPRPLLGQELRWVSASELAGLPLPEADAGLVALLTRT